MYKNLFLATLSGILFGISWPTYGFPLFIFFAFIPILLIEQDLIIYKQKKSYLKIFIFSYLSFIIWNSISIYWLNFAKRPDGNYATEAFLLPVLANSFLMSLVMIFYHFVKKNAGSYVGLLFLPCIWIVFEKLHLDWRYSFPWLNLGNVFADYHKWIQWYEFTGTFGGSLWILLVNIFIFFQYRSYQASRKRIYLKRLAIFTPIFIFIPIFISLIQYTNYQEKIEKIEVILVQPELNPYTEKYNQDSLTILSTILELAQPKITQNTDFIVAPETAFPGRGSISYKNKENSYLLKGIKNYLNKNNKNTIFVSGTEFYKTYPLDVTKKESYYYNSYFNRYEEYFNSAVEVSTNDSIEVYQKSKLVVGAELSPIPVFLNDILGKYVMNFGGTMRSLGTQKEPSVFINKNNNAKIAPIICYESIYGEYVSEFIKKGANTIFIVTNDSWWENSQGHKQLLAYAKLRAIENRRSISRSANSGISCFINQKGDVISELNYETQGALKGKVSLNNNLTVYSKYGDYIARILFLFVGILLTYTGFEIFLRKK